MLPSYVSHSDKDCIFVLFGLVLCFIFKLLLAHYSIIALIVSLISGLNLCPGVWPFPTCPSSDFDFSVKGRRPLEVSRPHFRKL